MDQEHAAWEARTEAAPGLTIAEARKLFDRVKNPNNWKLPVDSIQSGINADDRLKIAAAIVFYTGSVATWSRVGNTDTWRVRAIGYYSAVGA